MWVNGKLDFGMLNLLVYKAGGSGWHWYISCSVPDWPGNEAGLADDEDGAKRMAMECALEVVQRYANGGEWRRKLDSVEAKLRSGLSLEHTGTPPETERAAGLYAKFHVHRHDGRDRPGGDRAGARYIVLDVVHDDAAKRAALAYADALRATHPELAGDIRELVFRTSLNWPLPETERERLERALVEAVTNYREASAGDDPATSPVIFWGRAVDDAAGTLADHIIKEQTP